MYVKYGGFAFEPWEAGLSVRMTPNRTPRGFKRTVDVRFDISGETCLSGQSNINARLAAIQAAFAEDFQDIGLYTDADAPTVHFVPNNSIYNLTGNLVIYQQYPQTIEGEFISGRKFAIGVGAELLDVDATLVDYHDTIQIVGNAGPRFDWRWNREWGYFVEQTAPSSIQTIIHSGYAVAMTTNILPPPPFYQPPYEDNLQRMVTWEGPKKYPRGYTDYITRWRYVYRLPVANDALRPTRR